VGKHTRETAEREARIVSNAVSMATTQGISLRVLLEHPNNKNPAQARVYSLTPRGVEDEDEGDEENTNVVTGTIPLFGNLASTLFDSNATHSFISTTYVKLCSMITQPLNQNITVSTPTGDVVTCRNSLRIVQLL
jgi:hypothetical protein